MHRTRWLVLYLGFVVGSSAVSACAFPVFEFEQRSAPRRLAYLGTNPPPPRAAPEPSRAQPVGAAPRASVVAPMVPAQEPPATLRPGTCFQTLNAAGVRFEILDRSATPGVAWPIRLRSAIRGVAFEPSDNDATHAIMDCRLALSLLDWASDLRQAKVRRVEHYSAYRPGARVGGNGAVSGHAHGLAIDAARFTLDDGVVLDVLDDWEGRKKGQAPCPTRREESSGSRLLRRVTCSAVDERLFQVVLTPHYNKAHENHVHLERKPDVDWTYVR